MSEQYCYCLDNDHLIINIKTGYDVDKVFIIYGDPYEAGIMGGNERWSGKRAHMVDHNFSAPVQEMQVLLRNSERR